MKSSLIAIAATAALVAAPALAASQSADLVINGSIPAKCSAITLTNATVTLTDFESSAAGDVGKLSTAISGAGINVTGTSAKVTCNSVGTSITVDAEPMILPGTWTDALANGFSNKVDYTATVTAPGYAQFVGSGGVIATNATTEDESGRTVGLLDSNLNIRVGSASSSGTLIAGTYAGSVKITLTAAL